MRKMIIAAMLVSLVAVAAPAQAADPDPSPSVGVWACQPSELKPKPNACNAVIPVFPTGLLGSAAVTSVSGNIDKVESDDDVIGAVEKDPIALGPGGITYTEPTTCAAGVATGSIQIGDAGDIFAFTYVRAGATAAVLATSDEENYVGVLAFRPKNQDNTGDIDPQELALRCAGMWTGSQPLKIEFVGGGAYVEPFPNDD